MSGSGGNRTQRHNRRVGRYTPKSTGIASGPGKLLDFDPDSMFDFSTGSSSGSRHCQTRQTDLPQSLGVDWSRINESRHNWNRVDTFQTPRGHAYLPDEPPPRPLDVEEHPAGGGCGFQQELFLAVCRTLRKEFRQELAEQQKTSKLVLDQFSVMQRAIEKIDLRLDMQQKRKIAVDPATFGPVLEAHLTATKKEIVRHMSQTMTEINFGPVFEKLATVNSDIVEQCQIAKIDYKPMLEQIDKIDLRVEHLTSAKDEILSHINQTMNEKLAKLNLDIVEQYQTVKIDLTEELAKVNHDIVERCQIAKIDYKPVHEQIDKIDLRVEHLASAKDEILRHISQTMTEKLAKLNLDIVQQSQTAKMDFKPVLEQIDKFDLRVEHLTSMKDDILSHTKQTLTEKLAKLNLVIVEQCQTVKIDLTEKLSKLNLDVAEQCQTLKIDLTEKLAKVNRDIVEQCQIAKIDYKPVLEQIDKIDLRVEHLTSARDEILSQIKQTLTEKLGKPNLVAKIDYRPVLEQINKIDLRVEHLTATKDEILSHISQTLTEKLANVNLDMHQKNQVSLNSIEWHLIATKDEILRHMSQTMAEKLAKVNLDIVEQCQTVKIALTEKLANVNCNIVEQCRIAKIDYKPVLEKIDEIDLRIDLRKIENLIQPNVVVDPAQFGTVLAQHLTVAKDEIIRPLSQTMTVLEHLARAHDDLRERQSQLTGHMVDLSKTHEERVMRNEEHVMQKLRDVDEHVSVIQKEAQQMKNGWRIVTDARLSMADSPGDVSTDAQVSVIARTRGTHDLNAVHKWGA